MNNSSNIDDMTKEILRARAVELSREDVSDDTHHKAFDVVEFVVGQQHYGVEEFYVREVSLIEDITPVPGTPAFIAGIVNVHGRILPVIDIQHFLGLAPQGITDHHVIVVVFFEQTEVCLLADIIVGVSTVREDSVQPALSTLGDIHEAFLLGMTAENLMLLDIQAVLESPTLLVNQQVDQ